jgi:hypothetical protein
MFWQKPGFNQANVSMLNTVETIGITKFHGTGKYPHCIAWPTTEQYFKNPINRSNFLSIKAPTKRLKNQDKKIVNQHEKPPELFFQIHRRLGERNSTVLIIGAGSGGDVIGAIPCKQTIIIALEPDRNQFPHLVSRISNLYTPHNNNSDISWLNGRVDFNKVEAVEEDIPKCVGCDAKIVLGDAIALCLGCKERVHLKRDGRQFDCIIPKQSADEDTFCGDYCKQEYLKTQADV